MPTISRIQKIKEYLSKRKLSQRRKVGVLVDGPNMLRKEFNINLKEIREILSEYGISRLQRFFSISMQPKNSLRQSKIRDLSQL